MMPWQLSTTRRDRGRQCPDVVTIGWIRGSCPADQVEAVLAIAKLYMGDPMDQGRGAFNLPVCLQWANGARLALCPEGRRRCVLDLPGGFTTSLPGDELVRLWAQLSIVSFRPSRLDIAFDDYEMSVTPEDVLAAAMEWQFTGFRNQPKYVLEGMFETHYNSIITFGTRGNKGAGKCLRCYNKYAESKGKHKCIRWEAEFADERAQKAWEVLGTKATWYEFAVAGGMLVAGCISFINRKADPDHAERAHVLEWWADLVSRMGGSTSTVVVRPPMALERTRLWLMHGGPLQGLAAVWTLYQKAYGSTVRFNVWLSTMLQSSAEHLTAKHLRAVNEAVFYLESA